MVTAAVGWGSLRRRWGSAATGLLLAAGLGLALATMSTYLPGPTGWLVAHLPGGGLLRDGQRLVAPWAVLLSICLPLGVQQVVRRAPDVAARRAAVAFAVALPLLALPDLAWGAAGRLVPVTYPAGLGPGPDHLVHPWQR